MKKMAESADISQKPAIEQIIQPFQQLFKGDLASGVLLLLAAIVALILANSPFSTLYHHILESEVSFQFGSFVLSKHLIHWVNDGLMVIFFFFVGLEIKREILVGELASLRKAAFPILVAFGGMFFPAIIFMSFNYGQDSFSGWGIPMATDIAFALGILFLLGKRATLPLRVFLTAVAIADDIGAVIVIAFFYTSDLSWYYLLMAVVVLVILVVGNKLGIRHPLYYGLLGIILWFLFLKSGVHATIAGVLLAMTVPAKTRLNTDDFLEKGRELLNVFENSGLCGANILTNKKQRAILLALENTCEKAESPVHRFEHALQPWVAYVIMPLFALANAGVSFGGDFTFEWSLFLGVMLGLIVGKQLGITLTAWVVDRLGIARKPENLSWVQIYMVSWLAAIGFTMSIFITNLAFSQPELVNVAKVGVFAASIIAGVAGFFLLRRSEPQEETVRAECLLEEDI